MTRLSRRQFFGTAAAAASIGAIPGSASAASTDATGPADLIIRGARLLAMDPAIPSATAIAVRGERILAVGSDDDVMNLAGPNTEVVDGRGYTVTPGFIDAHSHPLMAQDAISANVNLATIAGVKKALAALAAKTPPGQWVLGSMYDDTKFAEGRPLTKQDIDEAVPDHPVMVRHRGGHTVVVNSRAFELAGITIDTPDPVGGRYFRENGELTGKVAEAAAIGPLEQVGTWPVMDRAARQQSVLLTSKRMAAAGLTSTTDSFGMLDDFIAYQDARAAGEMHYRLSFMPYCESEVYQGLKLARMASGFGDDMLRIGAVKFSADGSASERTMSRSTPYHGRTEDYGILTMTQEEIDAAVDDAVAHDFRIGIHANGDVAIDRVLTAYERVLADWQGENPRFRIEHCSLVNPSLLQRIRKAGVVPTPFYTYAHYHGNKWVDYGEEMMEWMFAHRSFLDYGIPVAPASDFTPGPYEPMMAVQSMVTRKDMQGRVWGPSQRISVTEALRICTLHGAYASFEEDIKGSLTPGKLADIVILEKDPHDVDPDAIKDIRVLRTILGGRTTYEA
ncbi:MAG: amidohydrolase [Woeseiaceae bacterium]|jgi:predicted amidohydrolase YtcJ|nr:amidohydrolase [Woeseiaceae bacterium]